MRFYYLFTLLAIYMSSYSQTPTQIDSLGYKFSINLPEGSEYDFLENTYSENGIVLERNFSLQLTLKINDSLYDYISVILNDTPFDKEKIKLAWLIEEGDKVVMETDYSLIIKNQYSLDLYYGKSIFNKFYLFIDSNMDHDMNAIENIIKIIDTATE